MSATIKRHCESRLTAGSSPANFGGVAVESYSFDSSDNVLGVFDGNGGSLPSSVLGLRYLFQGREYSWAIHEAWSGAGLYYFRARYYDPSTGRWLSNDPIGISGGLNQYAFCANNPVMFVDPEGDLFKRKDEHDKLANIKKYVHPDEAAAEALRTVWHRSVRDGVEYSGWIYRNSDGTYSFGEGEPGPARDKSMLPPLAEGAVAWYHTHPDTLIFSPGDDATLLFWWNYCKRNKRDAQVCAMYLSADGNSVITRSIVEILSWSKPEHGYRVVR